MVEIVHITPEFAIGPQIEVPDFAAIRDAGFKSVLNLRPDDEIGTYVLSDEAEGHARAAGLAYGFSPTEGHEIFEPEVIDRFERLLADLPTPIFSHCKTGTRSAMLWALLAARFRDVDEVIASLRAAGQELDFLEDELREQAAAGKGHLLQLKEDALLSMGRGGLFSREAPENE